MARPFVPIPPQDILVLKKINEAIEKQDKKTVAELVSFPFSRELPLTKLKNKIEFIEFYEDYFDEKTIGQILKESENPRYNGKITTTEKGALVVKKGKLSRINIHTKLFEDRLREAIAIESNIIHPSVRGYDALLVDCMIKNHRIRIQQHGNELKYFSWPKNKKLDTTPETTVTGRLELDLESSSKFIFESNGHVYQIEPAGDVFQYTVLRENKKIINDLCKG